MESTHPWWREWLYRRELYILNREHYYTNDHACTRAEYFLFKRKNVEEVKRAHRAKRTRAQALEEVNRLGVREIARNDDWTLLKKSLPEDATGARPGKGR